MGGQLDELLADGSPLRTIFALLCFYQRAICYRPSVRLYVCLSVTRVDQSKTVEVRIMQFLPYGSPMPLVFAS